MNYKNNITEKYLTNKSKLESSFPAAYEFLSWCEGIEEEGFHIGTSKNLHFYYQNRFLFYLRIIDEQSLLITAKQQGAIKDGVVKVSNEFLSEVIEKLDTSSTAEGSEAIKIERDDEVSILVKSSPNAIALFEALREGVLMEKTNKNEDKDPIKDLVERYKIRITENELKDEVYKWEAVNEFRGRPDTAAPDFFQELKSINYKNLIYPMALAVLNHLADERPEEIRDLFNKLFNDHTDLTNRVKSFNKESLTLYQELDGKHGHHQDERSISTYLTFYDPTKYTFYKASYYKEYCKLLGIKPGKKNEKYTHYLNLIEDLIEKYIIPNTELIELVQSFIPDYYDGSTHMLLAQDILYQMLEQKTKTSYWIFQGSPKIYDLVSALNDNEVRSWKVNAHKNKIKPGDKVILWMTGSDAGCYALGEVASDLYEGFDDENEIKYYTDGVEIEKSDRVKISITHNLATSPISKEQIARISKLKGLKVGNQGTNFSATKREYEALVRLASSQPSFEEVKNKFDESEFDTYIFYLKKILAELGLKPNDKRTVFAVLHDRLNFTVGQRYAFNLLLSDNRGRYRVISKEKMRDTSLPFSGNPPQPFKNYLDEFKPSSDEWRVIIESIRTELERTTKSGYYKFNNSDFENFVFGVEINHEIDKMKYPLNTILYGPPGTGKTYHAINHAVSIIEEKELNDITQEKRTEVVKRFQSYMANDMVKFVTFHQSMTYEDFVEGIKPSLDGSDKDEQESDMQSEVQFSIQDGIFKTICESARSYKEFEISQRKEIRIAPEILEDKTYYKMSLGNTQSEAGDRIYNYCKNNNCVAMGYGRDVDYTGVTSRSEILHRYREAGFEADNTDFNVSAIERLILWMKQGDIVLVSHGNSLVKAIGVIEGGYEYKNSNETLLPGVHQYRKVKWLYTDLSIPVKEIYPKNFMHQTIYGLYSELINKDYFYKPSKQVSLTRNHVLIIDEINRGNVSAIFGELITLLEKDKRKGALNELSALLPYSKETFSVPNNVYIIGTMNTADRSVEALDTALRRRFSFIEMPPDANLIRTHGELEKSNGVLEGIDLVELLNIINARVEKLVDKDHMIGHSYFLSISNLKDIKEVFQHEIIPLLQEYFFGDYGKIGLVIGNGFFEVQEDQDNDNFFAEFEYDTSSLLDKRIYHLKKVSDMEDDEFIDAINVLMRNSE